MDNKRDHLWHRHQDTRPSRSPVARFFREHKQLFLTGMLLCVLLVLLFGIFSQVPAPGRDTPPGGIAVVSYSTFVQQVKARNMLTVTMQGNDLTGALAHPLRGGACPAPPTDTTLNPFAPMPVSPPVDPTCAVYTRAPASGDAALLPLLHSSGVVITTLPVTQPPAWLNLFLKAVFIMLFLFLILSLPPRKGMFSLDGMEDKITQFAKSRARRFGPEPESEQRHPQPVIVGPGAPVQPPPPVAPPHHPRPQ